ncbi:hypothetical protein GCM10007938_00620 [Vibrio zhanjiangensis]|uniref:Phage tail protein n=1 Tax=Vibrio zhanjiangensis TaxID=1046128 RepID=A0ABQ6EU59_9VIBR|nr:hypothetical protein [Vibrio zhanjiangensis]GLT16286.1 hypothetical protein GCM10007938_00620 [Vibrio zhanjiangensis]
MANTSEIANLITAVTKLTETVRDKMADIDQTVDRAVAKIPAMFEEKRVTVDVNIGDDSNPDGPFKTLKAAIYSVPDGGKVKVNLPQTKEGFIYELDSAINIGSRKVTIVGGYSSMESEGYKPTIIKPIKKLTEQHERTELKGYFYGRTGGELRFLYVRTMLPRLFPNTEPGHYYYGAFISGAITFKQHNYNLKDPGIFVESNGSSEAPVPFLRSSARETKGDMSVALSYVRIETTDRKPLFDLQYGGATMRFSMHNSKVFDSSGAKVEARELFGGLRYGLHGYATNLLASDVLTKKKG